MALRNSKNHQKSEKKFFGHNNSSVRFCDFFDFVGTISLGFERIKNIFSPQKNQILRDLFICELGSNLTWSQLTLNRSLWLCNAFGLGSYKYMVFDLQKNVYG